MNPLFFLADLVAVCILTFGLFLPRHKRRDLLVAYLVVNVGVLAVTWALSLSTVTAGLGLGLFGVLSIIRLRSQELQQHEIAYYFAALSLGLLGGLTSLPIEWAAMLMAAVVAVVAIGDHPWLAKATVSVDVTLDRAITDPAELSEHVRSVLPGKNHQVTMKRVDLVNDTTHAQVRYTPEATAAPAAEQSPERVTASEMVA